MKEQQKEKTINKETIYNGHVITLEKYQVVCPNGKESSREVIRHHGGSVIIAVKDNKVILEYQYRFPYDETIIEAPAGKLNPNEDPLSTAYRELEEETGYKALNMHYLGKMYPSCGYTDEVIYMYYTDEMVKTATHFDSDEDISIFMASIDEVKQMIASNEIKDAKTIAAFYAYLLKK